MIRLKIVCQPIHVLKRTLVLLIFSFLTLHSSFCSKNYFDLFLQDAMCCFSTSKFRQKEDPTQFVSAARVCSLFFAIFKVLVKKSELAIKLGRITWPRLAIRQKLAASENICVWTFKKRPQVICLESESNTYLPGIIVTL